MYTLIYFSPTGNALHLAKILTNQLGPENTKISPLEFTQVEKLEKDNHLILIYPVHSFNAPRNVKRFVKDLSPGIFEHVSLIGVGCAAHWVNDAVSSILRKLLIRKNYNIILDEILAMPLTFIMAFPDELANKVIEESETKIKEISSAIQEGQKTIKNIKFRSKLLNFMGKVEIFASRLFGLELHANNDCTSCATCWDNCPSKNIKQNSKGKPKFGFSCLMCMRCIYNCPEKAISPRFSKFIPIKKGYSLSKYRN